MTTTLTTDPATIPWPVIRHQRGQVQASYCPTDNLGDVVYTLIACVRHCYRLSIAKPIDGTLPDHAAGQAASAFWFLYDIWPGIRDAIIDETRQHSFGPSSPQIDLTLFPKNKPHVRNTVELGFHTANSISKIFHQEFPNIQPRPERGPAPQYHPWKSWFECEAFAAHLTRVVGQIQEAFGEISLDDLSRWERAFELEMKPIVTGEGNASAINFNTMIAPVQIAQQSPTAMTGEDQETIKVVVTEAVEEAFAKKQPRHENHDAVGSNRNGKKKGRPKWEQAREKMLEMLDQGTLPATLRKAAKLFKADDLGYGTVQTAAHRSIRLCQHFKIEKPNEPLAHMNLLDELGNTVKNQFLKQPDEFRQEVERVWEHGERFKAIELVAILNDNPDAGSTGDVPLMENVDVCRDRSA